MHFENLFSSRSYSDKFGSVTQHCIISLEISDHDFSKNLQRLFQKVPRGTVN